MLTNDNRARPLVLDVKLCGYVPVFSLKHRPTWSFVRPCPL